jgi:hypothetical protein
MGILDLVRSSCGSSKQFLKKNKMFKKKYHTIDVKG